MCTVCFCVQDVPESLLFVKIFTAGHEVPSDETILSFKRVVRRFLRDNADNGEKYSGTGDEELLTEQMCYSVFNMLLKGVISTGGGEDTPTQSYCCLTKISQLITLVCVVFNRIMCSKQ